VKAIEYLRMGVEQYLRELPDDEYDALEARVRPPKPLADVPQDRQAAFGRL
jgi:hypothetical protein